MVDVEKRHVRFVIGISQTKDRQSQQTIPAANPSSHFQQLSQPPSKNDIAVNLEPYTSWTGLCDCLQSYQVGLKVVPHDLDPRPTGLGWETGSSLPVCPVADIWSDEQANSCPEV